MKTTSRLRIAAGLVLAVLAPLSARSTAPPTPVAIAYQLSGSASVDVPVAGRHGVRLFESLPKGAILAVERGSRLALAFVNGRRYEMGEGSRATLGAADLSAKSGPVRSLQRVPSFPTLAPIALDQDPGLRSQGTPIRGERIPHLYPAQGAAALASRVVLRFAPVEGAGLYALRVEDRQANLVFRLETDATEAKVPAEKLRPGETYFWSVRTVDRQGGEAEGRADFTTVPAEQEMAREALRRRAEGPVGRDLVPLLAGVDWSLGLLAEAREDLDRALQAAPSDTGLTEASKALDHQLEKVFAPEP